MQCKEGQKADRCRGPAPFLDSVLFLLFSLAFIAAILYLPHHVSILTGRAWYYINGEHIDVAATAREAVKDISDKLNATDGLLAKAAGALAKETVQTVAKSEL